MFLVFIVCNHLNHKLKIQKNHAILFYIIIYYHVYNEVI